MVKLMTTANITRQGDITANENIKIKTAVSTQHLTPMCAN